MSGFDEIHPQDVVRVSRRGRVFHALVRGRVPGGYQVEPLERGVPAGRVKAEEIVFHWRATGNPAEVPDRAQPSLDHLLDR
jgi:hypothetical protein